MEVNKLYKKFIESNIINNYNELIEILKTFPYYYKINEYQNIIKITKTSRSDLYARIDDEFLEHKKYKKILTNLIINKDNYMDIYYFGEENEEINQDKLYKLINGDIKLKNFTFYKSNDNIEYHICYVNNKWSITTKNKLDIYSIQQKNLFEPNTLYELLFKSFHYYQININQLNKEYNYVFSLNTPETNLTILENRDYIDLKIVTIIKKETNEEIKLNRENMKKFNLKINILSKIMFEDIFHFKKDIYLSNNQKLIIQNNETNEKYIYNYPKFDIRYTFLKEFNDNPIDNIKLLLRDERIETFMNYFPIYTNFIKKFDNQIREKTKYLFNRYVDVYIKKNENIEYCPYDKELLEKIHFIYRRTNRKIKRVDILDLLLYLPSIKIIKIFNIDYELI
jgi:hypothetical protein